MTLSSENFYISIFSEKPLGSIETKHDRNVHWIIIYSMFFFYSYQKSTETRVLKVPKKVVFSFCMWRVYFPTNFDDFCSLYVPYKILFVKYANIFYLDLNLFKKCIKGSNM